MIFNSYISSSYLFGFFLGLAFAIQSIVAIFHVNIGMIVYPFILIVGGYRVLIKGINKGGFIDVILIVSSFLFFLYAFVLTSMSNEGVVSKVYELMAFFLIFYVSRLVDRKVVVSLMFVVVSIGFIQSIYLLFARAHLYYFSDLYSINYLLLSLVPGLFVCISYMKIFDSKTIERFFWIVFSLIGLMALMKMQSRAVAIYCVVFLIVYPIFKIKNLKKYFLFSLITLLGLYYYYIAYFNESILYKRISYMANNIGRESRISTYQEFFNHVDEFKIFGYGASLTSKKIYADHRDAYPHNFFLEFWSDFGVIGLCYSILLVSFSAASLVIHRSGDAVCFVVGVIFLFYSMNFMKSFSIYDSPVYFISMGLVVGLSTYTKKNRDERYV